MEIRTAVHDDIEQICRLYNEFFAYNAKIDPVYFKAGKENGEYTGSIIESESADLIIAVFDDKAVGLIHIREGKTPPYDALMQNHYAQIIDFIVTEEHRQKGIGKELMDAAKKWAANRNLDYIELFVLQGAAVEQQFYENHGFVTVIQTKRYML